MWDSDSDGGDAIVSDVVVVVNIGQLATLAGPGRARVGAELRELGLIKDAALVAEDGRVVEAGPYAEVRAKIPAEAEVIDAEGLLRYAGICGCAYAFGFCG
jgi:imidazolonepropionase